MIPFDRLCTIALSINPASVSGNTTAEQTFTLNGIQTTDVILTLVKPTLTAGLDIGNIRVSAANQIAITFQNSTASPIDPPNEGYIIVALRPEKVIANAALFNAM